MRMKRLWSAGIFFLTLSLLSAAEDQWNIYYAERFPIQISLTGKRDNSWYRNVKQTPCWRLCRDVVIAGPPPSAWISKQRFLVSSEIPLEYVFYRTLLEDTLYRYKLECCLSGRGIVRLQEKHHGINKEYPVQTDSDITLSLMLGDGKSFAEQLEPAVVLQGELNVKSITLFRQLRAKENSICLGSITEISPVPDMEKSDYPDCYYTAALTVSEILDGPPVAEKIQLLIPAFLKREIHPLSKVMKKGKWKISIRPLASASIEEQQIQQVDEIESFLYPAFILDAADPLNMRQEHSSAVPVLAAAPYVSPLDEGDELPIPAEIAESSRKRIQLESEKVSTILAGAKDTEKINAEFQQVWNERQKEYDPIDKHVIWAKKGNSYFALPESWQFLHPAEIEPDNLAAIREMQRFFQRFGIVFIIQVIPDYRDIAALVLNPEFQKYGDVQAAAVVRQLLNEGIEAHYVSDVLVSRALQYERMFFYPGNYHPDEGATDCLTDLMAERLASLKSFYRQDLNPKLFSTEYHETGYKERLKWPLNCDIGPHQPESPVLTKYIYYNGARIESSEDSNILLIGNSFISEPMDSNAYGSYLAAKILTVPHVRTAPAYGVFTVLPQILLTNFDSIVKGRKIAILPIGIKHLLGKGIHFANIAKVDEQFKRESRTDFFHFYRLNDFLPVIFPAPANGTSLAVIANRWLSAHTAAFALDRSSPILRLPVPRSDRDLQVQCAVSGSLRKKTYLKINKKSYSLITDDQIPRWHLITADLPAGTDQLELELDVEKSAENAQLFLGSVTLFQKRDE